MLATAYLSHIVPGEKRRIDVEARYESRTTLLASIPVTSDLHGVRLVKYGIENRLFRKSRRKRAKLQRFDQIEFASTNRTIERNDVHAVLFRRRLAHDGTHDPRRS